MKPLDKFVISIYILGSGFVGYLVGDTTGYTKGYHEGTTDTVKFYERYSNGQQTKPFEGTGDTSSQISTNSSDSISLVKDKTADTFYNFEVRR